MMDESKNKAKPASPGLLIHCHGGGFVAQSSKSHECYLRDWAKSLKIPILSIDYSLAPATPFPRALEEVTYAYCWALKNHRLLGSTGEILSNYSVLLCNVSIHSMRGYITEKDQTTIWQRCKYLSLTIFHWICVLANSWFPAKIDNELRLLYEVFMFYTDNIKMIVF